MKKTYGQLSYNPTTDEWVMDKVSVHVAITLKRFFAQIPQTQVIFKFKNTMKNCGDIAWFIQRYPMIISAADKKILKRGVENLKKVDDAVFEIMQGRATEPKFAGLKEGQYLRHYQVQAIQIAEIKKHIIIADDIGLGKTYTAMGLLLAQKNRPAAIVVQTHLAEQWAEKITEFTTMTTHVIKSRKPYNLPEADCYIFRYSNIMGWTDVFQTGFFKTAIFDEIQDLRRGMESEKGIAGYHLCRNTEISVGLSATPIFNFAIETWNLYNILWGDENPLGTRNEFMREWCGYGDRAIDPDALGAFLQDQGIFIRRKFNDKGVREEIKSHDIESNPIIQTVDYDHKKEAEVLELAKSLALKTLTSTNFIERGRAAQDLDIMLRMMTGVAKAHSVAAFVQMLLDSGRKVLLAGWHRDVYSIWLRELKNYNPVMYTGSESPSQKFKAADDFKSGKTDLMIMSLRSGAGLDGLQAVCNTVVIGELDWTDEIHKQIIGRLQREGQSENFVDVFYLVANGGSDLPMVELLGIKRHQTRGIVDPGYQEPLKVRDDGRIKEMARLFLAKHGVVVDEEKNEEVVAS